MGHFYHLCYMRNSVPYSFLFVKLRTFCSLLDWASHKKLESQITNKGMKESLNSMTNPSFGVPTHERTFNYLQLLTNSESLPTKIFLKSENTEKWSIYNILKKRLTEEYIRKLEPEEIPIAVESCFLGWLWRMEKIRLLNKFLKQYLASL